jgi:solute carrier family 13 (sodium-dependent dicarboxylate transporter), member 2/3/5
MATVERVIETISARARGRGVVAIGRLAAILIAILVWFAPLSLERPAQKSLAVASFMIAGWITGSFDHALLGLMGLFLFWASGAVRFQTAFSGFSDSTSWFLFGAMVFGTMATKSGLARRLAFMIMAKVGTSYARLLLGLILSDFALTFLVPSGVARVVIMGSVALGLMEAFDLGPGSNVGRGLFIILTYTAGIFDKAIIAGAASIAARGLIEKFGGVEVLWSRWLLAYLPCDLITIFAAWRLTLWFYPPEKPSLPGGSAYLREELRKMGPWSKLEKKSAFLMSIAIVLWGTDFLHHISAPMVGLGVGLVAVLPGVGVLEVEDVRRLNFLPMFFVASCISMSQVLIETKGLDVLTRIVFAWLTPFVGSVFSSTMALYWTAFVYHIFTGEEVGMLGLSIPMLMQFAHAHNLNPLRVGMIWTFACGGKMFIYQAAVLIVGHSYGFFDGKDTFRIGLSLTVVQALILIFLVPLYWPLIGLK